MLFQEPKMEFIHLTKTEIMTGTGAGYTICQKVLGSDVGCKTYANGAYPSISAEDACSTAWCQTNSEATSYEEFNA